MTATNVTPARSISVAYVWRIWCGTMRALIAAAVATQQFLLDQLILLRGEWARQTVIPSGNIIRDEQVGQGRELLGPGKFFQHASQVDHIPGTSVGSPWRVVRPQEGQPAEKVRIATQLIERVNLRILSAQVKEERPDCIPIAADGRITQRGRYRFRRWLEELG